MIQIRRHATLLSVVLAVSSLVISGCATYKQLKPQPPLSPKEQGYVELKKNDTDFLVKISSDKDIIPLQLRGALAESSLLLLGFRLRDWDLRVLLRSILSGGFISTKCSRSKVAIQLDPSAQQWRDDGQAINQAISKRVDLRFG